MSLPYPYWLFINEDTRQAVAVYNPSFEKIEELKEKGFILGWDSAPSKEAAYQYAEEHLDCYENECRGCGFYAPTSLYRGQRFRRDRWMIFFGRLCEMCSTPDPMDDTFRVKPVCRRKNHDHNHP